MSVQIMSLVFRANFPKITEVARPGDKRGARRVGSHILKLVALALADHANDEGKSVYPSKATLENKTGLSHSSVVYGILALRQMGIVTKVGESRRGTTEYELSPGMLEAYGSTSPTPGTPPTGGEYSTDYPDQYPTDRESSIKPSMNHPNGDSFSNSKTEKQTAAQRTEDKPNDQKITTSVDNSNSQNPIGAAGVRRVLEKALGADFGGREWRGFLEFAAEDGRDPAQLADHIKKERIPLRYWSPSKFRLLWNESFRPLWDGVGESEYPIPNPWEGTLEDPMNLEVGT